MDWTTHAAGGEGSHERCGIVSCNACCARCSGASPGNYQVRARRSTGTSRISFDWGTPCVCPFRPQCAELLFRLTETGNRKDQIRNYAASCFKLFDMFRTSRSGNSANTLTVGTHRARCSSSSYLARSISTLFWAASFVQTRKHAEERAARYSPSPASKARSRFLQIGQFIPSLLRRSAGPTVCSDAVVVQKLPEIPIKAICGPGRECSCEKSSTKVSLPAHGSSDLISEELALSACSTGLNEWRPL